MGGMGSMGLMGEFLVGESLAGTFHSFVKCPRLVQIWNDSEFKFVWTVLLVEEILHPLSFGLRAHAAADFVASGEEFVDYVGADVAVGTGDEHE